jgi:predicted phage terminase large subunit-like protein
MDQRLLRERAAPDFLTFWEFFQTFVELNRLELPLKVQHRDICNTLQAAVLGQIDREFIIINMPPRVGKTKICEALACWQIAYYPDSQIIYTSYAHSLACESVRYVLETIGRPWFKELYSIALGKVQKADHFKTVAGGNVYGDGTGGTLTGRGAGLKRECGGFIVIDDPAKPTEALSKIEGEQLRFWFENTLKSRRNSSKHCPIIICAQRLASDDLPGFLLEKYPEKCHLLKFPAMVNGESTIPETVSTESLRDTERVNPFAFASQYQQEPVVLGGNLIKTEWLNYWDGRDEGIQWEKKIITADTALTSKNSSDWSVLQLWGRRDKKAYLIDQVRGKWASPELLSVAAAFWGKHQSMTSPIQSFIVEEAASGPGLIQQLQVMGIPAEGIKRVKDKVARVMDILAYPRTGMVYHPKDAPWLKTLEIELASFRQDGLAPHDDQVDAWADGVGQLLGTGLSILDVLGEARSRRTSGMVPVNMRAQIPTAPATISEALAARALATFKRADQETIRARVRELTLPAGNSAAPATTTT